MYPNTNHQEKIINILMDKKLYTKYAAFLPTPNNIREIINFANLGDIKQARKRITGMRKMADKISGELESNEKLWLMDIVSELNRAIDSL